MDELQRADECIEPLGLHALQLLPELSDDEVNDLQQADSVISLLKSWIDLEYDRHWTSYASYTRTVGKSGAGAVP